MPLAEAIATLAGAGFSAFSSGKELSDFLHGTAKIESVLANLVAGAFKEHLPRLQHLCLAGEPTFDEAKFCNLLIDADVSVQRPQDIHAALLPFLSASISAPEALYQESDLLPIYGAMLDSAVRGMWKEIGRYGHLSNEVLLRQNVALLDQQTDIARAVRELASTSESQAELIKGLADFARSVWQTRYDRLLDVAPPTAHQIDQETYANPFLLARAEDFNHNYEKLARLFQGSPEWDAIQRRTENVFIEGGRGTGKSMLLRRLTAQATLAAHRLENPRATFESLPEDYFGVYVKFTRGYYEQLQPSDSIPSTLSSLLAQHELNIEIFDAFTNTLSWLITEGALPSVGERLSQIVSELQALFGNSPPVNSLETLRTTTIKFEQNQLLSYYRAVAFSFQPAYAGSARDTVAFVKELSAIFCRHFSHKQDKRLFLLVDEFESLLVEQQVALNTVMKMRLPDVAIKVAVRRDGRKTNATFTKGDPIQKPRDYTMVPLDYDINTSAYRSLLEGIARRRLSHAGYPNTTIQEYLLPQQLSDEVRPADFQAAMDELWRSGNRRPETQLSKDFRAKYATACVYRVHALKNTRKSFAGFDSYVLLSSGIVSTFIELCKYTFYLALNDQLPLREKPSIPTYLQTDSVYLVSERLLDAIEGNVENVGSQLVQLLTDIGSILRLRLLHHPSEPEANRISIVDYDQLDLLQYRTLMQTLDGAAVWSVFHIDPPAEAYRPRNTARPPRVEVIINRIYCPALAISPRARWRAEMTVQDLQDLMSSGTRQAAYRRLARSIGALDEADPRQLSMFKGNQDGEEPTIQPDLSA